MKQLFNIRLFHIIFASISIFVLLSVSYLHNGWWGIELLSLFLVPIILLNLLLFIFYLKQNKSFIFMPLFILLLSIKPLNESIAINLKKDDGNSDFRIISYNIGLFNPDRMISGESNNKLKDIKYKWLREQKEPDILCLQEFFYSDTKPGEQALDSIAVAGNYPYYYMNPFYDKNHEGYFAVVTFSKFPALKSGNLFYGDNYINKGTWADFLIKGDTIRVLNFHLRSMSIRPALNEEKNLAINLYINLWEIYLKLKKGFEKRKEELKIIEQFIERSPHKIIICADLNALPYSSTYQSLKKKFNNSFEKAGTGFGFTYHNFPWFVRIDNQFYDKRLKINYFKTHEKLKISDHYPIEAGYSI